MPRVKVKERKMNSKELKKMIKDGNINEMFNQMLGIEAADPNIVIPRYKTCMIAIKVLAGKLLLFANNTHINALYPVEAVNIKKIATYAESLLDLFKNENGKEINLIKLSSDFSDDEIAKKYLVLKKHKLIKLLFIYHSQIRNYKSYLSDTNNLNDSFILNSSSYRVYPFKRLCSMNLYNMWLKHGGEKCNDEIKEVRCFILKFLHQFYKHSKNICEIVTKADVDIKQFSKIIIRCIAEAKKQIPRCDMAFRKIEQAIDLLEDNFDGYYKDFIKTENPSIIFQNFIQDVSNDQKKTNRKLIFQFTRIMKHFSKMQNSQPKNKQFAKSFDFIQKQLSTMTGNFTDGVDDDESDNEVEEQEDTEGGKDEVEEQEDTEGKKDDTSV